MAIEDAEQVEPATRDEWRAWLEANHERPDGVWLVSSKQSAGRPSVAYPDAVEEALCFGWIDSIRRRIDDERSKLWFTPRKPGSGWSKVNKERIERLRSSGRMAPAGERAIAAAMADGSWVKLDAVERLEVPDDLAAAFAAEPGSRQQWDAFPPSARRGILSWIEHAKRPETRRTRVEETARRAAKGERANQWTPKS